MAHVTSQVESALSLALRSLPTVEYGTPEFRERSVAILATACASGPVCRILPHGVPGFVRFKDVDAMLRNPRAFSSKVELFPMPEGISPRRLIGDDPPEHTRLRALFGQAFTPARVAETMEPRVLAITRELVGELLDAGRELDLCRDLAVPLPVRVISELLGVDPGHMADFKRWSDDITGGLLVAGWPDGPEKARRMDEIHQSLRDMAAYLSAVVADRRGKPDHDLVTFMLGASEGGARLRDDEILSLAMLLLVAGNETTTKLIGLMMNQLLANPPALADLAAFPGLIPGAVEETLRIEGPVYDRMRRTTRPCTVAGFSLPAGALVDCVIGAANLDASVFPDPTRFDVRRPIGRHFAFGGGIHQCLGAPLARVETRIAFEELLAHMQHFELTAPPTRGTVSSFRGFESMPVRYKPRETRTPRRAAEVTRQAFAEVAVADKLATRSDEDLGLDKRARETVKVARIRDLAVGVKMFRFVHPSGGLLTRFTAGSHLIVHMRDGETIHRNCYSLLNCEYGNGLTYIIAVSLDPHGKGGSRFMHEQVKEGVELSVSVPANNFPLAAHATKHLLVAGGIGITPLFAQRLELKVRGEPYELHYTYRTAAHAAFVELLELESDPAIHQYDNARGQRLDVEALLRRQPDGTHVYVCGPESLMDTVIDTALRLGWPKSSVHYELFGAPKPRGEQPFEVCCQRSGKTITVGANVTLLEALEGAGLTVPFSCRAGSCGACALTVLEGEIDHRDSVLTDDEKAEGKTILTCVSRGKTRLVLDM
jgi:cytochrome P450/ferredoxin-NADP reductase